MSIIQAVITNKNCIISGDSRITNIQNKTYSSGYNKILKLNNQIMFGITGNPLDSFQLFEGYCYYTNKGFQNINETVNLSYNDFICIITNKFEKMYNEYNNHLKQYDLGDIICGFNGKEFEIVLLGIGSRYGLPNGIIKAHKSKDFPYKAAIAGLKDHKDKFEFLAQKQYFKFQQELTIRQWKNIMQEVVDDGSKFDDTIDNHLSFESIKEIENDGAIYYK